MTVKSREIELVSSRLGYLKRDETRTILSRLILNNREERDETAKRSNEDRPPVPDVEPTYLTYGALLVERTRYVD